MDYGVGNLGSIKNMIKKLGHEAIITQNKKEIESAEKIILPGVGAFDYGMNQLVKAGLIEVLNKKVLNDKVPVLGVCLGAQIMCKSSEEGDALGLGWVDATVHRFPNFSKGIKYTVPHMGWDDVSFNKQTVLSTGLGIDTRFYFVHSYYIKCKNPKNVLCSNSYSAEYHSAFEHENIIGVQYHPEKSHKFGFQFYKNFIENY